jgi:hypothetical protein
VPNLCETVIGGHTVGLVCFWVLNRYLSSIIFQARWSPPTLPERGVGPGLGKCRHPTLFRPRKILASGNRLLVCAPAQLLLSRVSGQASAPGDGPYGSPSLSPSQLRPRINAPILRELAQIRAAECCEICRDLDNAIARRDVEFIPRRGFMEIRERHGPGSVPRDGRNQARANEVPNIRATRTVRSRFTSPNWDRNSCPLNW